MLKPKSVLPALWPGTSDGVPSQSHLDVIRSGCDVPADVVLNPIPKDANIYSGVGIPDNALVLSPAHLEYIRFPLHPLFHLALGYLDLHPLQLHPKSYLLISAVLAVGLKWGVSLGFADFFFFHHIATVRNESEYFYLSPRPNHKFFDVKPSSRNWKNRPILITGNWAAPELPCVCISSAFGPEFGSDSTRFEVSLTHERISWLNKYLVNQQWNISSFLDRDSLLEISANRESFIYYPYLGLDLSTNFKKIDLINYFAAFGQELQFAEDSSDRIRNSFAERQPGKERLESEEESDRDSMEPRVAAMSGPLPNPSKRPLRVRPEPKRVSGSDPSKKLKTGSSHSSCLDAISALVSSPNRSRIAQLPTDSSPDIANSFVLPAPHISIGDVQPGSHSSSSRNFEIWRPAFQRNDGEYVHLNHGLLHDSIACDAVMQGLRHPFDVTEVNSWDDCELAQRQSQHIISMIQLRMAELGRAQENKDTLQRIKNSNNHLEDQLKEARAELDSNKNEIRCLTTENATLKVMHAEVLASKTRLEDEVKSVREEQNIQLEAASKQIYMESAKHFRFGWVQGQLPPVDRVVLSPDEYDEEMGVGVANYEFIQGMDPLDRPSISVSHVHATSMHDHMVG